tara:strand:+ start:193 stop:324 length:132 start_codon:yes stop_codon:yes gene_type:complete
MNFQKRFVQYATSLLTGGKNGNLIGIKLNTARKNALDLIKFKG